MHPPPLFRAPFRVIVAAEDVRFLDFLRPSLELLSDPCQLQFIRAFSVRGCRPRTLQQELRAIDSSYDLIVVGADAKHGRKLSYRQKARLMRELLEEFMPRLSLAIADPCIEAWLLHNPEALMHGLEQGLEQPFLPPSSWPIPKTEAEAKNELGRLLKHGLGDGLPRAGFEFANEIVSYMDLPNSTSASLREWAVDVQRRIHESI